LAGGLGVLGIEGILYLEWNFVGPILLLAVLIAYSAARYLVEYVDLHKMVASTRQRLTASLGAINWRVLAFVIGVNILAAGALHSQAADALRVVRGTISSGGSSNIGELQGIGIIDIQFYQLFLIPILIGLYLTFARREGGNGFVATWFLCLLVLSLFAERILLLATPAACVLAGAGLAAFWTKGGWTLYKPLLARYAVALFFLVLVLLSYSMARGIGNSPREAVSSDWQDALAQLRDETLQDAVVMTWWDYGYWILDLAQRRPVVDNGYYGWDLKRMTDIRRAYITSEPSEAAQVMDRYGANYLIFSKLDENIAPSILSWPYAPRLENGELPSFPEDSLVARSLAGDFPSEEGLALWYASPDYENPEVVILERTRPQNP